MRITTGMIIQIRYSQRHQHPKDQRDHLWFVTNEERKGRQTMHTIRNMTTGVVLTLPTVSDTFIPVAPNPCP